MNDVGIRIKELRERKNIKQVDVARALEMDFSGYSRLEKRGDRMTVRNLIAIAGVLNVTISELLDEEQGPLPVEGLNEELLVYVLSEVKEWERKALLSFERERLRFAQENGYSTTAQFPDDLLEKFFQEYLVKVPVFRKAIRRYIVPDLLNTKKLNQMLDANESGGIVL